eukprot:g38.t1
MHMRVVIKPEKQNNMENNNDMGDNRKGVHPVQKEQSFNRRDTKTELHIAYENGNIKTRLNLLCNYPETNSLSKAWQYVLTFLIFVSVTVHCTSSMNKPVHWEGNLTDEQYNILEVILTIIFSLEFVVRFAVSKNYCYSFKHADEYKVVESLTDHKSVEDELQTETPFFFDVLNWVDFVAILPWFLEIIITGGGTQTADINTLITLSVIRLLRVLRIFKILRQFDGAKIMYKTAVTSLQPLSLTFVMLFLFFFLAASLIFIFEPCLTPDCTFQDVFNTGYFVIITLTTVGFGDQIPSNNMARFVAVITMLAGAVFLSMPIAVIGNQYENAYNEHEKEVAMRDPTQRKIIMAERHRLNTRNRKQRVLNTAISLRCYVCRTLEFDRKYHSGPKSPNKSVEELMRTGNASNETTTTAENKYVVTTTKDEHINGKSDKYIKDYRNVLLRHINMYHSLFLVDVRELFDLTKGAENEMKNEILRSHTLKIKAPVIQKKKTHAIIVDTAINCLSGLIGVMIQKGRDSYLKAEYKKLLETTPKENITFRDRLWIRCELKSASKLSRQLYNMRMFVMLVCVLTSFAHTMQSFNNYGEDSYLCKQVVNRYCLKINAVATDSIKASNPGCFPDDTTGYGGCIGTLDDCDWPASNYNITCRIYSDKIDFENSMQLKSDAGCGVNETFPVIPPFSDEYLLLPSRTPICTRTVCIANDQKIVTSIRYAVLELLLLIYFLSEYITRLVISRKIRIFLKNNLIDMIFVIIFVYEYILVLASAKAFKYTVWGVPLVDTFDPAVFRPMRLMIPIRFLFMASRIKGVDVCNETVRKVSNRMVTPLLFFFIGVIFFAGPLYVAELQYATIGDCETGFPGRMTKCFRCQNGENKCHVQDMFDAMWIVIVTMTSVGYGGLFPKTFMGKGIIMGAAIFGAFYMAMPLTIIGSQFYKIYKMRHSKEVSSAALKKVKKGLYTLRRQTAAKSKDAAAKFFTSSEHDIQLEYVQPDDITEEKVEFLRQYSLITEEYISNLSPNGMHEFSQKTQFAIGILAEHLSPEEHGIKPDYEIYKTTDK